MPKNQLATTDNPADIAPEIMEKVLIGGDLAALKPEERISYYKAVCHSLKLNPLTRPFEYIAFEGKLALYARRDCTEQLRARDGIEILSLERKTEDGLHTVIAKAKNRDGRQDEAIGAVPVVEPNYVMEWQNGKKVRATNPLAGKPLNPIDRAKALKVCETQAKRRVTLSLAGLGIPDESEIEGISEPSVLSITREEQAEAENAASNAKLIEAGGTVTIIEPAEPKKARAARKPKEETRPNWQDVIPHCWNAATTQLVGKKLSETPYKAAEFIRDTWIPKQTSYTDEDRLLIWAIGEYFKANPEPPQEPDKEEPAPSSKPEPIATDSAKESEVATEEPETPASDWRSAVLNLPEGKYGVGLTLGELATNPPKFKDKEVTPVECFRTLLSKGIPKLEARGTDEDKALIAAIVAAYAHVFWLHGMSEEELRAEVDRRFGTASLITRQKVLSEVAKLANLAPDSKELLRYVIDEWDNVEALIEGEKP